MAKRKSPTEADVKRITEAINSTDTFDEIKDKDSFDIKYQEYLIGTNLQLNEKFKNQVFEHMRKLKGQEKVYKGSLEQEIKKQEKPESKFKYDYVGLAGQKVVYARKSFVETKKGKRLIYRDSEGRYVRVSKKLEENGN